MTKVALSVEAQPALPLPLNDNGKLLSARIGGLETQRIYYGNFLELAPQLPDQSVDLIIADPPYNASKGNALSMQSRALPGSGGAWNKIAEVWDEMTLQDYLNFTLSWLSEGPPRVETDRLNVGARHLSQCRHYQRRHADARH